MPAQYITEPKKRVPIAGEADVIVAGARYARGFQRFKAFPVLPWGYAEVTAKMASKIVLVFVADLRGDLTD